MRYQRLVLGLSSVACAALIGVGTAVPAAAMHSTTIDNGAGVSAPQAVASGSPPDPALALAVAQWVTKGGEDNLKTLAGDFKDLEDAANNNDMSAISDSCAQLQTDVEAAQAYDPIPDPQAQHNWSAALADYAKGATDCVAGADSSNADLITKASTEITDGSTELNQVTTRLGEIAG
jgi:hypothetical protein